MRANNAMKNNSASAASLLSSAAPQRWASKSTRWGRHENSRLHFCFLSGDGSKDEQEKAVCSRAGAGVLRVSGSSWTVTRFQRRDTRLPRAGYAYGMSYT